MPQERDGFKEWGKPHLGSLLILGILSILGIFWGVPPKASCLCQPGLVGALLVCCVRSCFACFQLLASGGTKGVSHRLHMQVDYPRRRLVKNRGPSFLMGVWLLLVMSFRIGEASNPGPGSNTEWTFGLCNPSGLTSKTDHVASMNGSVWVCCETHLTQSGVAQLKQGLKTLGSSFQYLVPGFPCEQRTSEDVGRFSGVLLLSQYPARPIAQQFPDELFRTARIQVAGLCVAQTWIQVGMLYGVPKSVSHHQAKYQTECLLETLIDRLVYQTKGPRILCGDLNFQPHELQQLSRLRAAGFREVQDIAFSRWQVPPQPTGRGERRIDQIWISPELQGSMVALKVEDGWWADHSILQCTFDFVAADFNIDHWEMPLAFPWPQHWVENVAYQHDTDPSIAYASMWHGIEQSAMASMRGQHRVVSPQQCGRGVTLAPVKRRPSLAPCKLGREGDEQPKYVGVSMQHNRWFRQFRRLQALVRNVHKQGTTVSQIEQRAHLWQSIKSSPGFLGGFAQWWTNEALIPKFPDGFPFSLPDEFTLHQMCESFRVCLRAFEASLDQQKKSNARAKRRSDLTFVFKDCQKEKPPLVDALIQTNLGVVEQVNRDDQSIVFREPISFNEVDPILGKGHQLHLIQSDHDQLWVEDVHDLEPGDVVAQERAVTSDSAILHEFQNEWSQRWIKHSHLAEGQWDQICGFIRHAFRPMTWNLQPWTAQQVAKGVNTKKKTSATGADGVSRKDLLCMPPRIYEVFADMFNTIEHSHAWPKQLTVGIVSSLDKLKGGGTVDSYRPVTIYPLLYRVWSSCRARQMLHCLTEVLPSSVCGGVPGKQARSVWFAIAQLLEGAHFLNEGWQGVMIDIRRAFNALPRAPIWAILDALNVPRDISLTWGAFVAKQVRRFKVRQSVGSEVASNVGLPEGCALSVMGMILIDWLFDLWLEAQWQFPKKVYLYVDDWNIAFQNPAEYPSLRQQLQQFSTILDLEIDVSKSCAWGSHADDRKILRDGDFEVTLATRDLGAHQNFSLKAGNCVVTHRIKQLQSLWPKLKKSVAPYKSKVVAIRQMGWPKGLHAASIVHLGPQHFVTMRTVLAGVIVPTK